jgi:hypothetical protein
MPDSSVSLGVDHGSMDRDMRDAEGVYVGGINRMVQGTGRLVSAQHGLLKSNSRVASQFAHFFSMATAGGDSMSLLAGGITAAAHAMKLSLGLTAAGYVGGLAIQKVVEMREEWKKLNDELDRAAKPRDPSSTKPIEDDIKERQDTLEKAAKAKAESDANPWMTGTNWIRNSGMAIGAWATEKRDNPDYRNSGATGPGQGADSYANALFNAKPHDTSWSDAFRDGTAPDRTASNALRQSKSDEEIREEKVKAAKAQTELIEMQRKAAEIELSAAKRQQSKKESMQFSLEDLAKSGREWAPGNDTRAGDGRLARMALKEEALSRKAGLDQHWDEALQHRDRADRIKNGIGGLKDSDKDAETAYQRGLDSSVVLRGILANTAKPVVGKT